MFNMKFAAVSKAALSFEREMAGKENLRRAVKQISSKEDVFEAYAEQDTPAAYRIFFYYSKIRGQIIIITITPHP